MGGVCRKVSGEEDAFGSEGTRLWEFMLAFGTFHVAALYKGGAP